MTSCILCEDKTVSDRDNTDTVFTSILDVSLYNLGPYFNKEKSVTERTEENLLIILMKILLKH